jgi:hypothetical protein
LFRPEDFLEETVFYELLTRFAFSGVLSDLSATDFCPPSANSLVLAGEKSATGAHLKNTPPLSLLQIFQAKDLERISAWPELLIDLRSLAADSHCDFLEQYTIGADRIKMVSPLVKESHELLSLAKVWQTLLPVAAAEKTCDQKNLVAALLHSDY